MELDGQRIWTAGALGPGGSSWATRETFIFFVSRHNYFLDRGVKCRPVDGAQALRVRFMVVYKTPSIVGTNIFDLEKSGRRDFSRSLSDVIAAALCESHGGAPRHS